MRLDIRNIAGRPSVVLVKLDIVAGFVKETPVHDFGPLEDLEACGLVAKFQELAGKKGVFKNCKKNLAAPMEETTAGPELVFGHLWEKLQIGELLAKYSRIFSLGFAADKLAFDVMLDKLLVQADKGSPAENGVPGANGAPAGEWAPKNLPTNGGEAADGGAAPDLERENKILAAAEWLGATTNISEFELMQRSETGWVIEGTKPSQSRRDGDAPRDGAPNNDASHQDASGGNCAGVEPAGYRAPAERRLMDQIDKHVFFRRRTLFSSLKLVYLVGRPRSRSDPSRLVLGAVLDNDGLPVGGEVWTEAGDPAESLRKSAARFKSIHDLPLVLLAGDPDALGGTAGLEERLLSFGCRYLHRPEIYEIPRIEEIIDSPEEYAPVLGPRSRRRPGRGPAGEIPVRTAALARTLAKEVWLSQRRHVVCLDPEEERAAAGWLALTAEHLRLAIEDSNSDVVGHPLFRPFLKGTGAGVRLNEDALDLYEKCAGKTVLVTNLALPPEGLLELRGQLESLEALFRRSGRLFRREKRTGSARRLSAACLDGLDWLNFLAVTLRKILTDELENDLRHGEKPVAWEEMLESLKKIKYGRFQARGDEYVLRGPLDDVALRVFRAMGAPVPPLFKNEVPPE
ncbi:MAG: hypothetical protein LBO05_08320 [Deltaproteobacteria bacterium]|jgi:hypothetical protein|nr:hypothetical protein [Deltaproteobacteria bacterium]